MHILFLSDNFPPEVNAPASRTFEHCREWVEAGHKVTVVTCAPNFPKGKLLGGYRNRLWQSEDMEGIRVIRVWTYITANEGFFKRVLDYMSFMVTGAIASLFVRDVDVVIGTSPQFFTVWAAWAVSRLKRLPFVFEVRDLWPESITAVGAMRYSMLIRLLEKIEIFLYRQASLIVVVTHSFKEILSRRGINPEKIRVVVNGVDMARFKPREKDEELLCNLGLEGKFVVGYIGTHGLAHHLETLLEAAEILIRWNEDEIRFIFLGDGARKAFLVEEARRRNLWNVLFLDTVSKDEVVRYWSLLDVSVIHLKKTQLFNHVIPSKLFECIGMQIPVLHGVEGESAAIVRTNGIGLVYPSEDSLELANKIVYLKNNKSEIDRIKQGCVRCVSKYDRKLLARAMLDAVAAVAKVDRGGFRRRPKNAPKEGEKV